MHLSPALVQARACLKSMSTHRQTPQDLIELGRVVSAFGVRGWLKIKPHSGQPDVLLDADTWWLLAPGVGQQSRPYAVHGSREHSGWLLAQLEGVSDRDAAHALKNHTVLVSRAAFPQPDAQTWYWVDLMGCVLEGDQDGRQVVLGTVVEVSDNGAHALLHVRPDSDPSNSAPASKPSTILVPFVAAHVLSVDIAAKRIITNWPSVF